MDPEFVLARSDDVDVIIPMMRAFYAIDAYPFDEAVARRAVDDLVRDSALGRIWLIRLGDAPIGYIVLTFGYSLEFHGRDAFLDELFIAEEQRGRGVGTAALRFLDATCPGLGVHTLHLEVERHNAAAQALYRRFGFHDSDRYLMNKRYD
jgi:GNAT superfamily N-acetyltransferase